VDRVKDLCEIFFNFNAEMETKKIEPEENVNFTQGNVLFGFP